MIQSLADYDACRRVAYENVEDARGEGLDYVELRFSPWFMAERHGLDPAAVTEAVFSWPGLGGLGVTAVVDAGLVRRLVVDAATGTVTTANSVVL